MSKEIKIDTEKSFIQWKGSKIGTTHTGKLFYKDSYLKLENDQVVDGLFTVDMHSLTNEDLSGEWKEKFLAHIKSEDFFVVEKYPESTLRVKEMSDTKFIGDLTIKDKTHPVEIEYSRGGNTIVGKFDFNRTDYDMVYLSSSFFKNLGDKFVHDKVEVEFTIVLLD